MPNKNGTANGFLSYLPMHATDTVSRKLWVTNLKQSNQLQGPKYTSRLTRHFYPRSYGPGPMMVTGRAESQEDYQDLAVFIRQHHETVMTGEITPIYTDTHFIGGYRHLLQLVIPAEGIWLQGWVDRFTLSKYGNFDPAPTYTFSFFIAHDPRSVAVENSFVIRKWFTPDPNDLGAGAPVQASNSKKQTTPSRTRNNKTPIPSPNTRLNKPGRPN